MFILIVLRVFENQGCLIVSWLVRLKDVLNSCNYVCTVLIILFVCFHYNYHYRSIQREISII